MAKRHCSGRNSLGKSRHGQGGVAVILALIFLVIALGIIISGTTSMRTHRINAETWFKLHGQANAFAKAGLTEALAWYRRQSTQPVTTFAPALDQGAVPPVLDTMDPAVGLVREFEITGSLYGRYEVPLNEVEDISLSRGMMSDCGGVWLLLSRGYVYRRNDPTKEFNETPNTVLTRTHLTTEIRRFTLTPPAKAAICAPSGTDLDIYGSNSKVYGEDYPAVAYLRNTGLPTLQGTITGGSQQIPASAGDPIPTPEEAFGIPAVFGDLSKDDLRSLSDVIVETSLDFPCPMAKNTIVFADCSLSFDSTRPLKLNNGAGILIVDGNLYINAGINPCYFTGFIYVTGNVYIYATSVVRGQIVAKGRYYQYSASDAVEVEYDDGAIEALLAEIGQYRFSRTTTNPHEKD